MAKFFASTSSEMSEREKKNMARARKIATQGMVLLENDGTLPIRSTTENIALYGSGARRTVKGGTGSGDVNSRMTINVEQGLKETGFVITTESWLERYDRLCEEHMNSHMQKMTKILAEKGSVGLADILNEPYQEPDEPEVTEADIENSNADIAVYVLARNAGESKDRSLRPGDYELSAHEQQNLAVIAKAYAKTIVVLNVGGVIDTKILRNTGGINAILLMSQAGNISGYALADVLTGKETPSGHLASTWAENYSDYPNAHTFSYLNGDVDDEYYEEGIYVGYRYFDTFGIAPAYPFGYGLTYTTFSIHVDYVTIANNHIRVLAEVTNTGAEFSGKEVVQVYYSAPNGKIEKPYQELAGYAKTKELKPGEAETVEITFPIVSMASYDEERAAYILEPGEYAVRVGNNSRNTHIIALFELDEEVITEKLSNRLLPDADFKRLSARGVEPYTYEEEEAEKKHAEKIQIISANIPVKESVIYSDTPIEIIPTVDTKVTLDHVIKGEASLDELVSQLSIEEMVSLCVGTARGGFGSVSIIGAASTACPGAAGDTTSILIESRNVPNIVLADGPAGLRLSKSFVADAEGNLIPGLGESALGGIELLLGMEKPERPEGAVDYYQYCTAIPIATLLAQTWDIDIIEEAGDIVGEEMKEFGVTLWLAPGMNIHRNPLCGRNFEYYSEDPLVSGKCAAADTRGVQRHRGCGTTIKHFALNNQEDNRAHCNEHCSERAIREIYLKGFEIAVKESQPLSLMTSYNLLNGIHTANHHDLLTAICRDEWNFEGVIMTDWGTTGGGDFNPISGTKYGFSSAAGCIKAGNDLIMPGSQKDVDDIIQAVYEADKQSEYPLTKGELQACARRVLRVIMKSVADKSY
ncbi:MAG: beta-glucosidase [Lachnospiraceae bacterium]|nr:beta-glucosidase [Lachnospiraceae bacterium]